MTVFANGDIIVSPHYIKDNEHFNDGWYVLVEAPSYNAALVLSVEGAEDLGQALLDAADKVIANDYQI